MREYSEQNLSLETFQLRYRATQKRIPDQRNSRAFDNFLLPLRSLGIYRLTNDPHERFERQKGTLSGFIFRTFQLYYQQRPRLYISGGYKFPCTISLYLNYSLKFNSYA